MCQRSAAPSLRCVLRVNKVDRLSHGSRGDLTWLICYNPRSITVLLLQYMYIISGWLTSCKVFTLLRPASSRSMILFLRGWVNISVNFIFIFSRLLFSWVFYWEMFHKKNIVFVTADPPRCGHSGFWCCPSPCQTWQSWGFAPTWCQSLQHMTYLALKWRHANVGLSRQVVRQSERRGAAGGDAASSSPL